MMLCVYSLTKTSIPVQNVANFAEVRKLSITNAPVAVSEFVLFVSANFDLKTRRFIVVNAITCWKNRKNKAIDNGLARHWTNDIRRRQYQA